MTHVRGYNLSGSGAGYIALSAVLVLSAVFLSVSISMTSYAISGLTMERELYSGDAAYVVTGACAEHALMELVRTLDYAGSEHVIVGDESCDIIAIEGSGNTDRVIRAESTVAGHVWHTEVSVAEISPALTITSWEDVMHF